MKEIKKYKPILPFKDCHNCKGHSNYYLDCTYETQEERELLVKVIENYITNEKIPA